MKAGFTIEEWQKIRNRDLGFLQNTVINVAPYTGLTNNALAHLRDDWIDWYEDHIELRIPAEAPCNSFKSSSGPKAHTQTPPMLVERDKPCFYCRNEGNTDKFENRDLGGESQPRTYRTILHRELAAPAVNILEKLFQTYDRSELASTPGSITKASQRATRGSTESDEQVYSKLRRTGAIIYTYYGLSPTEISTLTPYTAKDIKNIVGRTPQINYTDEISSRRILKIIDEEEPVTISNLQDRIDLGKRSLHKRLTKLKEEGRLTVSNNHRGIPPATWKTTDDWDALFRCEKCDFTAPTLRGLRNHRAKKH